jgi:hypothetical protein
MNNRLVQQRLVVVLIQTHWWSPTPQKSRSSNFVFSISSHNYFGWSCFFYISKNWLVIYWFQLKFVFIFIKYFPSLSLAKLVFSILVVKDFLINYSNFFLVFLNINIWLTHFLRLVVFFGWRFLWNLNLHIELISWYLYIMSCLMICLSTDLSIEYELLLRISFRSCCWILIAIIG